MQSLRALSPNRSLLPVRFTAAVVIAAIFFSAGSALAQTPAGKISAVTGNVEIIRAGKSIPATVGAQVDVGDQLKTASGANVAVLLTDKSRFELGESAQMTIDKHSVGASGSTTNLGLAMGALRNWVTKLASGNAANYEVHTPNAVAAARGTVYEVHYQDNVTRKGFVGCRQFTDVAVYQDSVDVYNPTAPGNQHVLVQKGQKTTVPCALIPLLPAAIAAAETSSTSGAAAAAGGLAATGAGVLGGLTGAGAFDNTTNSPASPSQ